MLFRLISKRFRIKENKHVFAAAYSLAYFAITLATLLILSTFSEFTIARAITYSVFIGAAMFIVYLIKWELSKIKGKK